MFKRMFYNSNISAIEFKFSDISGVVEEAVAQAEKGLQGRGLIFKVLQTGW